MARIRKHPFFEVSFTQVPSNLLRDPDLSDRAKALYGYMASHSEEWELSTRSMARHLGKSKNTVIAAIRELEAAGWVTAVRRRAPSGADRASEYWMQVVPVREDAPSGPAEEPPTGGVQNLTPVQNLHQGGAKSDPESGSKSAPLRRSKEDQSLEDPPYVPHAAEAAEGSDGAPAAGAAVSATMPSGSSPGRGEEPPVAPQAPTLALPIATEDTRKGPSRQSSGPNTPSPRSSHQEGGYSASFLAWWAKYPRKIGKRAAAVAYEAALKHTTPEAIDAGLDRYLAAGLPDGQRFIPHPRTWLAQGRYEDDYTPVQVSPVQVSSVDRKGLGYLQLAEQIIQERSASTWTNTFQRRLLD